MSETPRIELPPEPEWVQRMRAAGYNIRVGTVGEPMSEIPEAFFYPPPTFWNRTRERIQRGYSKLFRILTLARWRSHAPLP
jgi:hypothetical protein